MSLANQVVQLPGSVDVEVLQRLAKQLGQVVVPSLAEVPTPQF